MKMLIFCITILSLGLAGCTKATPKMEQNKELSGVSVVDVSRSVAIANGDTATINGKCTKIFSEIEVSFSDSPSNWYNIKNLDSSAVVSCSVDGTFTVNFDTSNPIYAESMAAQPASVTVQFRGVGEFGNSKVDQATISISYISGPVPAQPTGISLTTPLSSPGTSATPTLTVNGIFNVGDTLEIYEDSACSTAVVGSTAGSTTGTSLPVTLNTLSEGAHTFWASVSNINGASPCSAVFVTYVYDNTPPKLYNIYANPADNGYKILGDASFLIYVSFGEDVTLPGGGSLKIDLDSGAVGLTCTYAGSPSFSFTCPYTVTTGHSSADLNVTKVYVTGGAGTIADLVGNATAVLSSATPLTPLPSSATSNPGNLAGNNAIVVDGIIETVVSVTSSSAAGAALFKKDDVISIQVQFSDFVVVNTAGGTPKIEMIAPGGLTYAIYASGSGTKILTFDYTVMAGDLSSDLEYSANNSLASYLSGGTIKDIAGNSVDSVLPDPNTPLTPGESLGDNEDIAVDGNVPTLILAGYASSGCVVGTPVSFTTCGPGGEITYIFTFSENIIAAAQSINLSNGKTGNCTAAVNDQITCTYTVEGTGSLSDSNDLSVTGFTGTILDGAGNPFTFNPVSPGVNGNFVIDTKAPKITGIGSVMADGTYQVVPQLISVDVTFDEPTIITDAGAAPYATVSLNTYPQVKNIDFVGAANVASTVKQFSWAATKGYHSDGYLDVTSVNEAGGIIKDAYGNQANLDFSNIVGTNSFKDQKNIILNFIDSFTIEAKFPLFGANWTDYVAPGGDIICSTPGTGPNTCLHGGERRKISVPLFTSCSHLTVNEDLLAFNWECQAFGDHVEIYSTGLKEGKGLADLINGSTWATNRVTIHSTYLNLDVAKDDAAAWWTGNGFSTLANSISNVVLGSAYTIYVANSALSISGLNINNHHISVVAKNGLNWNVSGTSNNCTAAGALGGAYKCMLYGSGKNFLWIEGNLDGLGDGATVNSHYGVLLTNTAFSRLHNLSVVNTWDSLGYGSGIWISGINSKSNLLTNIRVSGNAVNGLNLSDGASYNVLHNIVANSNGYLDNAYDTCGVKLYGSPNPLSNNTLTQLTLFNNGDHGLCVMTNATQNTISHVTSANNGGWTDSAGIYVFSTSNNTFNQIVTINNSAFGLKTNSVTATTFSQMISRHNNTNAVKLAGTSDAVTFKNIFGVGTAETCAISGTSTGIDASCIPVSTAKTMVGDLSSSFIGKVTSTDANGSAISGSATNPTDWFAFSNPFRGWGADGGNFVSFDNRSTCGTNCRIWDWSLRYGGTEILGNASDLGANLPFADGNNDCAAGADANLHYLVDTRSQKMLTNALEVVSDDVGDNDGLCETNETCIYTGNFGSYQGHGTIDPNVTCNFAPNLNVQNVKLLKYPSNGVP